MATTNSPLNIKGSIKGLSFYTMEGSDKIYVREKGGASRDHIRKSKKFKNLRLAQNELRGRAKFAKDLRFALGQWANRIVNRYLQAKIAAALQEVMNIDGILVTGTRSILLSRFREALNLVTYHYNKVLSEILFCPYSVETGADRKSVTVKLKGLNPRIHIKAPSAATHFQLCVGIGRVADYIVPTGTKIYMRPYGANAPRSAEAISEWIPINGPLMDEISITAALPDKIVLQDDHTVVRSFGIVFGKMTYDVQPIPRDRGSIKFLGGV